MPNKLIEELAAKIADGYINKTISADQANALGATAYAAAYMNVYMQIIRKVAEYAYIMPQTEHIMSEAAGNKEPMGPLR